MTRLEEITTGALVSGVLPAAAVTVHNVDWHVSNCIELTYKDPAGSLGSEMLYRKDEPRLHHSEAGQPWSFGGDGAQFRLAAEAHRIRLALQARENEAKVYCHDLGTRVEDFDHTIQFHRPDSRGNLRRQ